MNTSLRCVTHRVSDNIGEERRLLVEAAEDQLTDHQGEVEVERCESQLICHFALKCKTRTNIHTCTHTKRQVQTNLWALPAKLCIYMQAN